MLGQLWKEFKPLYIAGKTLVSSATKVVLNRQTLKHMSSLLNDTKYT